MKLVATPLKRACVAITRGSAPTYAADDDAGEGIAIGQSCVRPDGSLDLTRARPQASGAGIPEKGRIVGGEVLVNATGTGTLGRVAMVREPVQEPTFVDSHVTLLRVDATRAEARFLAYTLGLPSARRFIEDGLSIGATKQRELSVEALRAHSVALPGPGDQAEIADFLDRECERIDGLGQLLRSPLLTEYRDSLITEAVTGQLDVTKLSDARLDQSAHAAAEGEAPEVLAG